MKNRRGESSLVKNEKLKLCYRQPDFENYKRDSNSYCSNTTIDDYQQVENYLCKGNRKGGGGGVGGGGGEEGGASESAVNEMIFRVIVNLIPYRMTLEVQCPLKNRQK